MSPLPVFPDLLSAVPAGLHVTVIFFCGAVILFSSVACGFFFFNAFGRPYETLHGPVGLYLWTSISCETRNTVTSQTHTCTQETVFQVVHLYLRTRCSSLILTRFF